MSKLSRYVVFLTCLHLTQKSCNVHKYFHITLPNTPTLIFSSSLLTSSTLLCISVAPSAPNNVVTVPLSSFAVNVTWEVPTDMGGRAVTRYQVNLTDTASGSLVYSKTVNTQLFRFVNSMAFLEPSTMYQ